MSITLGNLDGFTLNELDSMDLTLGELSWMSYKDLLQRARTVLPKYAVQYSQELEQRIISLENKCDELANNRPGKKTLFDKVSLGIAVLTLIVPMLQCITPTKYEQFQMENQEKVNAIATTQIVAIEENTEALIDLNANIEELLSQTAILIDEQQKSLDQNQALYDEIKLLNEKEAPDKDTNAPENIGNTPAIEQNALPESLEPSQNTGAQSPELG